jgi:hypothetical protein
MRTTAAWLWLCAAALGVEVDYKAILVTPREAAIEVRLPLTDVTGPARVKQRAADGFGLPIAPTKTTLDGACYLEWQISYDSTTTDHPSLVPEVKLQREGRTKYGCELTKILADGLRVKLWTRDDLAALRRELDTLKPLDLETAEQIALVPEPPKTTDVALPAGFERFVQKVPQLVKSTPHGAVEIQFKPKQRAVGYQPMVYVCLPQPQWHRSDGKPRSTGRAKSKETVLYRFTAENRELLFAIVRAFAIASKEHNEDLAKILDALLSQ